MKESEFIFSSVRGMICGALFTWTVLVDWLYYLTLVTNQSRSGRKGGAKETVGWDSGSSLCCQISREVPAAGWTRSVPPEVIPTPWVGG